MTAWRSALPLWPDGIEAELAARAAEAGWRSSGTSSTGALSASLVQRPAWTPMPVTLPPSRIGTTTRSSGTRRWTEARRSALASRGTVAALLEIAHRAERSARIGRLAGDPEQAERVGGLAVGPLDLVAEQGHRAVGEPAQQGRAFLVAGLVGVGAHPRLHRPPVGDRGADVGEDPVEIGDDRRGGRARRRGRPRDTSSIRGARPSSQSGSTDGQMVSGVVARDADDRMEQAVDDEAARGERVGDANRPGRACRR